MPAASWSEPEARAETGKDPLEAPFVAIVLRTIIIYFQYKVKLIRACIYGLDSRKTKCPVPADVYELKLVCGERCHDEKEGFFRELN